MLSAIEVNEEGNRKTVENIIRSCTPQDIHKHNHNEPILISHVNVNEPECAVRNNGRMKRKMYWMNQDFLLNSSSNIKCFNHPIRGTDSNLNVNKAEIYSRSPNQKNRIVFEGEFKKKIKHHLFENINDNEQLHINNQFKSKGLLMDKIKRTIHNCRVDEEVEKYKKDFMKIMKTSDLNVLNKCKYSSTSIF